jgi:site-specific DNA-methyltransferase (adenine-specific)
MSVFSLALQDATSYLGMLPAESIDLIITDPAYSSLEAHRATGTTTRLTNEWFPVVPNDYFADWFAQAYRVLRPDRHLYMMVDATTMFIAKPIGEEAGFTFWKPLVWDKQTIGMGYHYRARCEFILFFEKGHRNLADLGMPDIIECKRVRGAYPTEKPVAVGDVLVRQSAHPGEVVLDTFCGSGALLDAAVRHGCDARGCDIQPKVLAPDHGFNSERSKPSENGGRP